MKKIFCGIGILLAVFTIYFSLLCADKDVYVNDMDIYDISFDKAVSGEIIEKYAKQNDVMVQALYHKNVSFGTTDIKNKIINPEDGVHGGRQDSVFPQYNIVYDISGELSDFVTEYVVIQTNQADKVVSFCDSLKEDGISCDYFEIGNQSFSVSMLFNELNTKFFFLILMLSVLAITMFYIYRLKEIGILRLNGWSALKVSAKILVPMSCVTVCASAFLAVPFLIYVLIMDKSFLSVYVRIYLLMVLFILVVFFVASAIASVFIARTNQVNAIKNGRNNCFIFYSLVIVKLIIVLVAFWEICKVGEKRIDLDYTKQSAGIMTEWNMYKVMSSCSMKDQEHIWKACSGISDEDWFNFLATGDMPMYSAVEVYGKKKPERKMISDEYYNMISMSDNFLPRMNIKDINGVLLEHVDINDGERCYLVPEWMQNYQDEIEQFLFEDVNNIIYIQNDQIYSRPDFPGVYLYDCIICVHKPEREYYSEPVLLTENAAKEFNRIVKETGLSPYIINAVSTDMDSDLCVSNLELELWESVFYLIIIMLAYVITSISIILIYLEFKKKYIGVYVLLGRMPVKAFAYFFAINITIIAISAALTDYKLISFSIIEFILYTLMTYGYLHKKATEVLKGA